MLPAPKTDGFLVRDRETRPYLFKHTKNYYEKRKGNCESKLAEQWRARFNMTLVFSFELQRLKLSFESRRLVCSLIDMFEKCWFVGRPERLLALEQKLLLAWGQNMNWKGNTWKEERNYRKNLPLNHRGESSTNSHLWEIAADSWFSASKSSDPTTMSTYFFLFTSRGVVGRGYH